VGIGVVFNAGTRAKAIVRTIVRIRLVVVVVVVVAIVTVARVVYEEGNVAPTPNSAVN